MTVEDQDDAQPDSTRRTVANDFAVGQGVVADRLARAVYAHPHLRKNAAAAFVHPLGEPAVYLPPVGVGLYLFKQPLRKLGVHLNRIECQLFHAERFTLP